MLGDIDEVLCQANRYTFDKNFWGLQTSVERLAVIIDLLRRTTLELREMESERLDEAVRMSEERANAVQE
jgi:hypothetical protein